jgi:hypothetical protein
MTSALAGLMEGCELMPKIAISYRSADAAQVGRIRDRLTPRYGEDSTFIYINDVPPGTPFPQHIKKVWSESGVVLAMIGPSWLRRGGPPWLALALRYLALPTFLLLVAHYLIINALNLDTLYLRIVSFLAPLPFGASFYWGTRAKPIAAFAVGAMLGVIAASSMTVSTSLRYDQSIMPSETLEWLENIEYVVTIMVGFLVGNMLARLPGVSSWFHEREHWVWFEIETALRQGIPIIPVLLDGVTMPTREQLPRSIREIVYCAATQVHSGADFDSQMARLIAGIDKILADRANQPR